jgi:hypothetical protein
MMRYAHDYLSAGVSTGRRVVGPETRASAGARPDHAAALALQRSAGNRATSRLLQRTPGGTTSPSPAQQIRMLKELISLEHAAPAVRVAKAARYSKLLKWMQGSPNWLRAMALAAGVGGATPSGKFGLESVEKPEHVEAAERELRDKPGAERKRGSSGPPKEGGGQAGGTRHPSRNEQARMLKDLKEIEARAAPKGKPSPERGGGGGGAVKGRAGGGSATPKTNATPTKAPAAPKGTALKGAVRARFSAVKDGITVGIKGAFSAPNLASVLPEAVLAIADRVAARDAIRRIQLKFLKEGFGRGVAAGLMRWSEDEVHSELKNRDATTRVKGMGDPAGFLKLSHMVQMAEAYENYGVDVGYQFSSSQPPAWKDELRTRGYAALGKQGYHFGADSKALFKFRFVDSLYWVLRSTTDQIIDSHIT